MTVGKNFEHYGFTYTREVKDPHSGEIELKEDPVQVGAIMIENSTGKILSFIGGRDHSQEATNHATQAYRQNGSSMKPLLVFAPAIEYGVIGAGSPVVDVKFNAPQPDGSTWSPSNYNATAELGIIPAREALAKSLNLATARLYRDIIDQTAGRVPGENGYFPTYSRRLCKRHHFLWWHDERDECRRKHQCVRYICQRWKIYRCIHC